MKGVGKIIPAVGLFVGVGVMLLFGIAILGGVSDDVRETVSENQTATFDSVESALSTTLSLTNTFPWILIMVVLALGILCLVKIR